MKDGQTIGQWMNWDFKTDGDLEIYGKNKRPIYLEGSNGYWTKYNYDSKGRLIYREDCSGFSAKYEYDSKGECIYYETSSGEILDNRPPQIIEQYGRKYQLIP